MKCEGDLIPSYDGYHCEKKFDHCLSDSYTSMDIQDGDFTYKAWKCKACERGYWWDDAQRNCVPRRMLEEENCLESDSTKCVQCQKGYFFNGEKCIKIFVENCEQGYNYTCLKCLPSYDLWLNTCTLSKVIKIPVKESECYSNEVLIEGKCKKCSELFNQCGRCKMNSFGGVNCLECENNLDFID